MNDYHETRNSLIEMLEDLDDRLSTIIGDIKEPLDRNFDEQARQAESDRVLDALNNVVQTEMVLPAIARIDKGQYGLCQVCGKPISKEQLKAAIYSSLCIKCASQADC